MQRQKYKKLTLIFLVMAIATIVLNNSGPFQYGWLVDYSFFFAAGATAICCFLWALMPAVSIKQQNNTSQVYKPGNVLFKEIRVMTTINFIVLVLAGLNYQATKDSDAWAGTTYVIVIPIVFVTGIFCLISVIKLIHNPIFYNTSPAKAWAYAILVVVPYLLGYGIAALPPVI